MFFAILTLFPEALESYIGTSILREAQDKGLAKIRLYNFRDFTRDRHRTVDDRPYGGGPGMVLKPEPILDCVEWLDRRHGPFRRILLCPGGKVFTQRTAQELLTGSQRVLLLCGRYEGFDERVRLELQFEELSLGDFVLSGGELPALAVVEACVRLIPGVLGDPRSAEQDSFQGQGGLDCPHYTRPPVFRGRAVPPVLLSGNHREIDAWRKREAYSRTLARRPELTDRNRTATTVERPPEERRHPSH